MPPTLDAGRSDPQPDPAGASTDDRPGMGDRPGTGTVSGPPTAAGRPQRLPLRLTTLTAAIGLVIGVALIVVALRAHQLGLAPPDGQSWAQVVTGTLGTMLTIVGLAILTQPFPGITVNETVDPVPDAPIPAKPRSGPDWQPGPPPTVRKVTGPTPPFGASVPLMRVPPTPAWCSPAIPRAAASRGLPAAS